MGRMNFSVQIMVFVSFTVFKTHELNGSTFLKNSDILPVVGENITLVCAFTNPSRYRELSWLHVDNNNQLIASNKGEGTEPTQEKGISDASKYSLMSDSSSGNLTISYLGVDDSGRYRCLVATYADAFQSLFELKVLSPATPSSVLIIDNRSVYTDGESVTLTIRQTHNLTCTVQGSRPPPELEWHNPGEVAIGIGDQYNTVEGDYYYSRRVICITPSRQDDGKSLQCIVSHRVLDRNLVSTVHVEVQVPPTDLFITTSNEITISKAGTRSVTVSEDTVTSFICTSVGSRPTAVITWSVGLDGDPGRTTSTTGTNQNDTSLRDTESLLLLNPNRSHHHQFLRCVATAGMNKRHTEMMVMVKGPSDPPILDGTQNLQDGVLSNVTCTSNYGYPEPTFQWYIGAKNVTTNSTTQTSLNTYRFDARSVLKLTPTKDDHGKHIVCQVSQANVKSRRVNDVLFVLYPPVIVYYSIRRVFDMQNSVDAILTCRSDSRPTASITWSLNGTEPNNSTLHQIQQRHLMHC
ncbi:synaptogenesis protein syg-2-like [Lytechinus variegatus]|uniref:synaptogenesis protein syg-2-like n=1 Tax=Lytechinus variegatus TaxID=7654 RepID=UPI001BB22D1F|nr:synaptogenesis protein syg-2-like [Lytechinus variegatus]